MRQAKKSKPRFSTKKVHTSIYLLPRHRAYLQNMMDLTGLSMTNCIAKLIDDAMPKFDMSSQ